MPVSIALGRAALAFLLLLTCSAGASAQATQSSSPPPALPYEPSSGQEGKDVVWVPTSEELVEKMLDLAKVTADDFVIDLGSGDGRTVIAAARRGATALGIEYNPDMVALSQKRAAEAGVADRATFKVADLFASDFGQATVLTMFLLPDINVKLRPQILELKPGTRVVSNTFTMGDWDADKQETVADCVSWCTALLWIVPAKVDGAWQTPDGTLTIAQKYQRFTGTLGSTAITGGTIDGDRIEFDAGGVHYSGRVNGTAIEAITSGGRTGPWTARRAHGD
jgi:SAM-dependent methyltransferase